MNIFLGCFYIFLTCIVSSPLQKRSAEKGKLGTLTLLDEKRSSEWLNLDQLVALSISDPEPKTPFF